jgi:hypothetical protein
MREYNSGEIGGKGTISCLSHYHEINGLVQTHEKSVDTTDIYSSTKSLHCHNESPHTEYLNPQQMQSGFIPPV